MGEQFIDLFAAGAYALDARLFAALAQPGLSWLFYLIAAAGIVSSLLESALEQRPELWLRHLAAVAFASILVLVPQRIELDPLTYAAPGQVERLFGTRTGAAPHLTYWIERFGAAASTALRDLGHARPVLAVPGVAAQVADLVSDPATLNDPQLKANLEIWRRRIAPQLLRERPDLEAQLRDAGLIPALLNPTPALPRYVGAAAAGRAQAVASALAGAAVELAPLVASEEPMLRRIVEQAGASPWVAPPGAAPAPGSTVAIRFTSRTATAPSFTTRPDLRGNAAYDDALQRGDALAAEMRAQLPEGGSPVEVARVDRLYDLLARSILSVAGTGYQRDEAQRAALGSLCQRAGEDACRAAQAPLPETSARLRVIEPDRYNTGGLTTWFKQPLTTLLLTVASAMIGALSSLVVSVLPFALGVAKAIAIVVSMIGLWMLLWPGRTRIAISWMVGPIAFVSLWSVLFNIWADIETWLSSIAALVGDAEHGSWSASRIMSIAISLGYLGLPSLALGVIYGESGRALYRASGRLENALMMAWHARHAMVAFGRRWLTASPLARRWNQRAYQAVGLGSLRSSRAAGTRTGAARSSRRGGGGAAPPKTPVASTPASGSGSPKPAKSPSRSRAKPPPAAPPARPPNPRVKAIVTPR